VEWSGQPRRAGPAPSAAAALSKIVAQMTAGSVQERHPQRRRRGLFVETRPPPRPQPRRGDIKALVAGNGAPDGAGKSIWDAGGYKDAAPHGAWAAAKWPTRPKDAAPRGSSVLLAARGYKDCAPTERHGSRRRPDNESRVVLRGVPPSASWALPRAGQRRQARHRCRRPRPKRLLAPFRSGI
jgi:hypothetical protein